MMNLKDYLEIIELCEYDDNTHKIRRDFALGHNLTNSKFLSALSAYKKHFLHKLILKPTTQTILKHYSMVSALMGILVFVLGVGVGAGLLSYSGNKPVNVIYFLAMVVVVPMLSAIFSLWAMFVSSNDTPLLYLSPAFWLEMLFDRFVSKDAKRPSLDTNVAKNLIIKKAIGLSIIFYIGVGLALVWVVSTQDIAFAWSSTLDISSVEFASWLDMIAYPWSTFLPQATIDANLVEVSRYFRLGGEIPTDMLTHANMLGAWWKFLAMATLVYAILFRVLLYIIATIRLNSAIKNALSNHPKLKEIFQDMQTPIISTKAITKEEAFAPTQISANLTTHSPTKIDAILGWGMDIYMIHKMQQKYNIECDSINEVGGMHTLKHDNQIISQISGSVVVLVKSWETPTGDFVDFIEDLSKQAIDITIITVAKNSIKKSDYEIWRRKIASLKLDNISIKGENLE